MLQYPYGRRPVRRVPVRTANGADRYNPFAERRQPARNVPEPTPTHTQENHLNPSHAQDHQPPVEPIATEPINTPAANNGGSQHEINWQQVATQLQADMDNFRKRQKRQAEEAAGNERERLLRLFLPVVDNLARALNHNSAEDDSLRQGVELTYREFARLMAAEGVSRIETVGQPFDPSYHDALATIATQAESGTIVQEVEAGYTLDGKLLRPAKVLVAA